VSEEVSPSGLPRPSGGGSPRRRLSRRRRANVAGGRKHSHRVLVTPAEEAKLQRLALDQGVSVPRLLIESAFAGTGETPTQRREAVAELFAVHRLLAAISNNVNQLARHANAGDEFPAEAGATLDAVRRVAARVSAAIDELAEPSPGRRP
jgi:hypothetical protein